MKNLPKKKFLNRGFSLVELIIVMTSTVLIFSIGYANYRGFQKRQHLENAVRQIKGDLRLAQEMALANRKPMDPPGNSCETNELGGYIFSKLQGYTPGPPKQPAAYEIYAACPDWARRVLVKGPAYLPDSIDLADFGGGNRFLFMILGKGVDKSSNVVFTLSFVGGGVANKTITITPSGRID